MRQKKLCTRCIKPTPVAADSFRGIGRGTRCLPSRRNRVISIVARRNTSAMCDLLTEMLGILTFEQ